jgi:hypothetical protein
MTKRSRTEEIEDNQIGSLGEINVNMRLLNSQKTESFNIFHDNTSFFGSDMISSQSK